MYRAADIRELHVEPTTRCGAGCPMCPRHDPNGATWAGLPLTELDLPALQSRLAPAFVAQLRKVLLCGNYGDGLLVRDLPAQLAWLRSLNGEAVLTLHTHGSGRDAAFWRSLAESRVAVRFAIDGLADTHALYRPGTSWERVMASIEAFRGAGGRAEWDFLVFRHNEHQVEEARALSERLGFARFNAKPTARFGTRNDGADGPERLTVLNRSGSPRGVLETPQQSGFRSPAFDARRRAEAEGRWERHLQEVPIRCKATHGRSLYLSAEGQLFPCCWLAQVHPRHPGRAADERQALLERLPGGALALDPSGSSVEAVVDGPYFQTLVPEGWGAGAGRLLTCARSCPASDP